MAERVGFEPTIECPDTAFPVRHWMVHCGPSEIGLRADRVRSTMIVVGVPWALPSGLPSVAARDAGPWPPTNGLEVAS